MDERKMRTKRKERSVNISACFRAERGKDYQTTMPQ